MHTDCDLEPLRKEMTGLDINLMYASKNEYFPEIERFVRTVKERIISARAIMAFKRTPKLIIVHTVASAFFWHNTPPQSTPVAVLSDTKVSGQLILVNTVDYKNICRLQTGEYVQVYQEDEPLNMIAMNWTVGAISLEPQYNCQGGKFFESLLTGKLLLWSHWTLVNITEDVIEQYETFNTKGCPKDHTFGGFNDQPIPSTYSDIKNYYYDNCIKINASLR